MSRPSSPSAADPTALATIRGIPPSRILAFKAMRNGSELGSHAIRFTASPDELRVEIEIDYAVKLGFITAFRYRLRAQEIWRDGVPVQLRADTNNNGKPEFMQASRTSEGLVVEGTRPKRYVAPAGTVLCAHWNRAQLSVPSINPQDGSLLRFTVTNRGPAKVADTAGQLRACTRHAMVGANSIDLWYDADDIWTALQATAPDGSTIVYLPIS